MAADNDQQSESEPCDSRSFRRSTIIDNEWLPLKPGMRFIWHGTNVDEEHNEHSHRAVFTVTDLTKQIDGVEAVVCWGQAYVDDVPAESEIVFFAQEDNGTVWRLGQYVETYDNREFVAARCWIDGIQDGEMEIVMLPQPELGTSSYSEKQAPRVLWTDRGVVFQVGQRVAVPFGSFENAVVIHESSKEESGARRLNYYARDVGHVRVDRQGKPTDGTILELTDVEPLCAEEMAQARDEALELEARAYERSADVFAPTKRSECRRRDDVEAPSIELPTEVVQSMSPTRQMSDEQAKESAMTN